MKTTTTIIFLALLSFTLYGKQDEINVLKAEQYFKEAKTLCDQDAGKTWGINLYGPILFVDAKTRKVISNVQDAMGELKKEGNVFVGMYPKSRPIANTALEWNGTKWTMVIWQALSSDKNTRNHLIMHELWHRIQDDIGFRSQPSKNTHLNQLDGRFLLKMEWSALGKAVETNGKKRAKHLENALLFREYRRNMYSGSAEKEALFEMHEGLADHTGLKLSGASENEIREILSHKVKTSLKRHTLLMSFAYTSGPLYGYLLDASGINWYQNLKQTDDLGELIKKAYGINPNPTNTIDHLYAEYNGEELIQKEKNYEEEMQAFLKSCRDRFLSNPKLIIPMSMCRISFNPHTVVPFEDHGTIYKTFNAFGKWGKLKTDKGALVTPNWSKVIADAPDKDFKSDNWELILNEGWKIEKKEDGNYYVVMNKTEKTK
ncbi:MAG: hypothetical protein ACEPOZ_07275 [Marinifilaceae bacterium]